ncbi:MAG: peptide MFS transporter [Gemmatimonadales bacterium]|nr:peptide MFS transporter [Gemmatimonadales bacterium]
MGDHPGPAEGILDTRFFGHPRGLSTLFFTEMWERFSYYGMRAILILFMTAAVTTGGLGFPTEKAGIIYGTYVAMVYLTALPGGWLADKFLGQRKAVFWGGVVIMLGHICLAVPSMASFYLGLAFVVIGTGLLKPNVSAMVGELYSPEDRRRDAGFSIFYVGINLGAGIAPLVCGYLAQDPRFRTTLEGWGLNPENAWHWGFGAAAVGMALGIIQYRLGWKKLGNAGMHPARAESPAAAARQKRQLVIGLSVVVGLIALVAALSATGAIGLTPEGIGVFTGYLLLAVVVIFFGWLFASKGWTRDERKRLVVIFVLFMAAAVFWSVFEQAGSTLNLFAERSTNNSVLGFAFPASWWQAVNSAFLILFSAVFAWLWVRLGTRDPSSPAKFSLGLFFVALSFIVMIGAAKASSGGVRVSPGWLLGVYFLQTVGELCLSPVGLSAMTRLAPARIVGMMMGVWFLATSVGNYMGGRVASMYERFTLPTLFGAVAAYAMLFAIILALLIKPIKRMLARAA